MYKVFLRSEYPRDTVDPFQGIFPKKIITDVFESATRIFNVEYLITINWKPK